MAKFLLIAGGGTGGHIFPGIAIAEAWRQAGGQVLFVGTQQGQEKDLVPKYDFPIQFLKVGRLKGAGLKQKLKTFAGLPLAFLAAQKILKEQKPDVVLGIGGYASGPMCLAAKMSGKKTAITDQNVQPGITNRFLGQFVDQIFLSFAESEVFFPKKKTLLVGNAIRSQIQYREYELPKDKLRIFVFGGSQGAVTLNQRFLEALKEISSLWPQLEIVHQAGKTDLEEIQKFYWQNQIQAEVSSFFDNMSEQYQKAHLVIARAGAGTLTELALSGRPAILVPYPFAADDHQTKNAEVFVTAGGALIMQQQDLSGKVLAEKIREFFEKPEMLAQMAANMKRMAMPDAAQRIVGELMGLCRP